MSERAAGLWLDSFQRPQHVLDVASEVVDDALVAGDVAAACAALRAEGMAHRALRQPRGALPPLDRAVALATEAGDLSLAVLPLVTRAGTQLSLGRRSAALRDIDRASRLAPPEHLGPVDVQKAIIHLRLGRPEAALEASTNAIRHLKGPEDRQSLATALMNRGLVRTYLGQRRRAETDLRRARRLYDEFGDEVQSATVTHNLGFAALYAGDIPAALASFDDAAERLARVGVSAVEIQLDRCDALLAAGLAGEAAEIAAAISRRLDHRGLVAELGEAQLILARALAALNDHDRARATALEARRIFRESGRPRWSAQADLVLVEVASRGDEVDETTLDESLAIARRLDAAGLSTSADRAFLAAGLVALRVGDRRRARRCLQRVSRLRRSPSIERRLLGWTAEARLRAAGLAPQSTMRAVLAGVGALEELTALLGAPDLEAGVARSGADLVDLGLDLAVEGGRIETIFGWAERGRSRALRRVTVSAGDDPAEQRDLARMRLLAREVIRAEDEELSGAGQRRELARVEASIRNRARRRRGTSRRLPGVAGIDDVADTTGPGRVFAEYFEHGGRLCGVVVSAGGGRLVDLAPVAEIERARDRLMMSMRRALAGAGGAGSEAGIAAAARALRRQLVDPIDPGPATSLVVVPPAALFDVPWRLVVDRPGVDVTVAPSATVWLRAETGEPAPSGTVVLAAGPGLDWAEREVEELAGVHRGAHVLLAEEASVGAVLAASEGAALVHLAAHGRFRSDNPMFSSIELADGPLTGYDVQRIHDPPQIVVLANCESAATLAYPGNEIIGVSAALLRLGVRTVVSSVVPVDDWHTSSFMVGFHRALREGRRPSRALLEASPDLWDRSAEAIATHGAFVVIGAG